MASVTSNKKEGEKREERSGTAGTVSQLAEKAKETAAGVAEQARDIGSSAVKTADSAAATVGGGMRSAADTMKQYAPREGMLGSAASAVTAPIEQAGRYLQEQGVSGAAEDMTKLIQKHPIPAILIGIGLGFLLARVTRS